MKKILFIDRDGTIIYEPADEQIDSFDKLQFLPSVLCFLGKIVKELDFEIVMVTNQDGLGTDSFPEDTFWPVHNLILSILKSEGITFSNILIDTTFPHEHANTRKPNIGLVKNYINNPEYDLKNSYVIGDRITDVEFASNMGSKSILIGKDKNSAATYTTADWEGIYHYLKLPLRKATVSRKTKETNIKMSLTIDGSGKSEVISPLGFLTHMLELFTFHSGIDLSANITGDIEVDEHHTIEDTALVLGTVLKKALSTSIGIERYGYVLPMDESAATCILDFSGRSTLVWDAEFKRESVGSVPTELFSHFFKSFSDSAQCTLHLSAYGSNEHHKIEALFKAFGRAIKQACRRNPFDYSIPSTKGLL